MSSLDIRNTTKEKNPSISYEKIARFILPDWDISLVFVGTARAQKINIQLRKKDYIPNVLSYALGKKSGEIVICLKEARRQAPSFSMPHTIFVGYLFIHGLSHLKGYQHGTTMERYEERVGKRFLDTTFTLTHETKNLDRH